MSNCVVAEWEDKEHQTSSLHMLSRALSQHQDERLLRAHLDARCGRYCLCNATGMPFCL